MGHLRAARTEPSRWECHYWRTGLAGGKCEGCRELLARITTTPPGTGGIQYQSIMNELLACQQTGPSETPGSSSSRTVAAPAWGRSATPSGSVPGPPAWPAGPDRPSRRCPAPLPSPPDVGSLCCHTHYSRPHTGSSRSRSRSNGSRKRPSPSTGHSVWGGGGKRTNGSQLR